MNDKNSVRIYRWAISVEIDAKIPTIYLQGQNIKEARNILILEDKIPWKCKSESITILDLAQECNASLLEIRSIAVKGIMRFSFEFEFKEEFLKFEKTIKKLSLS